MAVKPIGKDTYLIDYRDGEGDRHRKIIRGSKTFAKEVLNKIQTKISEGIYFPDRVKQNTTFKEAAEKYWSLHCCTTKGAAKTKYIINELIKIFGNKRLNDIKTFDIQTFYNRKVQKTTPSTANRNFAVMRAIFNRAIAWDIFNGINPCNKVARKRENPARMTFLTKEQIKMLLKNAPSNIKPILKCALMTGMRRGEILNLTWNDIDLVNGIIYIRDSKSGKSRQIPMIPELIETFQNLPKKKGKVFDIKIECLRKRFNKLLKSLNITNFRWHDLRHTMASQFVMNNGDLVVLKELLGHSSMNLTLRYSHLAPEHIRKETQVISSIFH